MTKKNLNFKNVSREEIPERKVENLFELGDEPPPLVVLEDHGVIGYHWIQELYRDISDTEEKLFDPAKLAIFQYLRHKKYFLEKGKGDDVAEKQYKQALSMAKEMGVFQ